MRTVFWLGILLLVLVLLHGCAEAPPMEPLPGDDVYTFRWDQGALHGSDHATCPSAVFVVRDGVLVECAP